MINKNTKKAKRAQGWGMDLIIAVTIFTFGLLAFFLYSLNSPGESKENIESLSYNGKILANTILSEGSPVNWDTSNVIKIGILTNDKIDETKLKNFYDLANADYNRTKEKFGITYDYYFFLEDTMNINGLTVYGIGKEGVSRSDSFSNAKNLIKITRYTIYKNKPITAYFYIWEKI